MIDPGDDLKPYDTNTADTDAVIERSLSVHHRAQSILMLLKVGKIPFSDLTVEALIDVSVSIENALGSLTMEGD